MNRASRRDGMERLLRSASRPGGDARGSVCPDAEMLAAFVEGSLSSAEARAVTAHAADCARCQAVLAALGRAADEPVAGRLAGLLRSPFRWLVPIGSLAAASLALYIAIRPSPPEVGRVGTPPRVAADRRLPSPAAAASATPERDVGATVPQRQKAERQEYDQRKRAPVQANTEHVQQPPASEPAAAPPATPAPPAKEEQAAEGLASGRMRAQREDRPGEPKDAEELRKAQSAEPAAEAFADRASKVAAVAGAPATPIEVRSPDGAAVWRVGPGPSLARSTDGGATWVPVSRPPGFALAAAAPSSTVCWIVGRDGLVLVTRDGERWARGTPPSPADLVDVTAADADRAAVRTADGREFVTADGARTWSPSGRH